MQPAVATAYLNPKGSPRYNGREPLRAGARTYDRAFQSSLTLSATRPSAEKPRRSGSSRRTHSSRTSSTAKSVMYDPETTLIQVPRDRSPRQNPMGRAMTPRGCFPSHLSFPQRWGFNETAAAMLRERDSDPKGRVPTPRGRHARELDNIQVPKLILREVVFTKPKLS
mmetsp:Transcript_38761/g.93064  ORF Transcript_38761/g.93064 Transcript_38761/m.93064 type:complete len:168 (+) Transcript_38761:3-506(+)